MACVRTLIRLALYGIVDCRNTLCRMYYTNSTLLFPCIKYIVNNIIYIYMCVCVYSYRLRLYIGAAYRSQLFP